MPDTSSLLVTPRFALTTLSGVASFAGWTMLHPILSPFVDEQLAPTASRSGSRSGPSG